MNEREQAYQGMQQAALQGQVSVRPSCDVELPEGIGALIAMERDAEIARLRKRAAELELLSSQGYLKEVGLKVESLSSFDLAGRMAKKGWSSLTWTGSGWRVYYAAYNTESSASRHDVEAMLRGE